jgi:hypothetical protein
LGIKTSGTEKVLFGGRRIVAKRGEARVEIEDPRTAQKRIAKLEVLVLPIGCWTDLTRNNCTGEAQDSARYGRR